MIQEMRKLLRSRRILALLLVLFLLNGALFYRHCTEATNGVTMAQIQSQYARNIDLQERTEALYETLSTGAVSDPRELDSIYDEYFQVKAAAARVQEAQNYEQTRTDLIAQSQIKIMLGLFGDEDSFEVRSLKRGMADYQALSDVTPEVSFFGGIELLTDWPMTDLLVALIALLPSLMLFAYEREMGLQALTQPTRFGRWRLYARKYAACLVTTVAATVLLFAMNWCIVRVLFGPVSLSAPVQSVYGFSACPVRLSIGQFLLCLLGEKLLWGLACVSLMVALSAALGNVVGVIGAIAAVFALELAMSSSNQLWIRWLSLVRLADGQELFQGAIYLNFFGIPLRRLPVCLTALAVIACAGGIFGAVCNNCSSLGRKKAHSWHKIRVLTTNLTLQETRKSLFLRHGAAILLIFAAIQLVRYQDVSSYRGTEEQYYRNYSQELSGLPSPEKDKYIQEQTEYFDGIFAKLQALSEKYDPESQEYEAAYSLIANQLQPQSAFEQATYQYQSLEKGQSYLYETPYEILLGVQRRTADAVNYAIAFLMIAMLFSGFFAGERESGMDILQTAAGKNKGIFRRKMLLVIVYTALIAGIAFIPRIWSTFAAFGGWLPTAQANSYSAWQSLSSKITVLGAFALQLLKNYGICLGAGCLTCFFSKKIGSTFLALLVSLCCLLIPVGIVLIAG